MAANVAARQLSSTWGSGIIFVICGNQIRPTTAKKEAKPGRGLVAAFHRGGKWQVADDPQPGASGNGVLYPRLPMQ